MIRSTTWVYDIEVAPNFIGVTFIPLNYGNKQYQSIVDTYIKVDTMINAELAKNTSTKLDKLRSDKSALLKAMNAKVFNIYKGSREDSINHTVELEDFFNTHRILYGYNSNNYDKIILAVLLKELQHCDYEGFSRKNNQHITTSIYQHSQMCINYGNGYERTLRDLFKFKRPFDDYDIQKILYLDKSFVALKQVAISLKWYRIQTLPFKYNEYLEPDVIPTVNDYNVNDVLITRALILNQIEEVLLREELSAEFDSNLFNLSRSSISTRLFSHFYGLFTGLEYKDFKDLRTERRYIHLKDVIKSTIEFKTKEMQRALDAVLNKTIVVGSSSDNDKFKISIPFRDTIYTMGLGGLHSQDTADLFSNEDGYIYKDADVTSYYPNGILIVDTYPAHLQRAPFRACVGHIKDSRVKAKANGEKAKAEGLKITINAAYGKFRDAYSFLYDPLCTYTVTVNLQLYLLMLIEKLEENGIHVISANTDGIVSRYLPNQEALYTKICNDWEKTLGFNLEYTEYEKYVRNDVNNYIAIKKGFYKALNDIKDKETYDVNLKAILNKYVKYKGLFIEKTDFNKGYFAPVIAKALNQYFIFGINYIDYINNYIANNGDTAIYDFCISQKANKKFKMVLRTVENGEINIKEVQTTNRFYVTNDKATTIVKYDDETNKNISILTKVGIHVFNNFIKKDNYDVDYLFYIRECGKIINGKNKSLKTSKKPRNLSDDGIIKHQLILF